MDAPYIAAVVQMAAGPETEGNLTRVEARVAEATTAGARLVARPGTRLRGPRGDDPRPPERQPRGPRRTPPDSPRRGLDPRAERGRGAVPQHSSPLWP